MQKDSRRNPLQRNPPQKRPPHRGPSLRDSHPRFRCISVSSTLFNLVFFLLTLCRPREAPNHDHSIRIHRFYNVSTCQACWCNFFFQLWLCFCLGVVASRLTFSELFSTNPDPFGLKLSGVLVCMLGVHSSVVRTAFPSTLVVLASRNRKLYPKNTPKMTGFGRITSQRPPAPLYLCISG